MNRPWIAFFSQTGTEINDLSNALGIYPELIVTNKSDLKKVNKDLLSTTKFREHKLNRTFLEFLPAKPVTSDYLKILEHVENPIITLHGYLRIVPKEICEKYEMYNLHPGLINKYPSLKGFNPQERAFAQNHKFAGCVLHKVTPGVDEGETLLSQGEFIEGLSLDEVYMKLRQVALDLWISFFKGYKFIKI
jgi:folate-dependent phosphoribosylglycinamide formyltransferase PurN